MAATALGGWAAVTGASSGAPTCPSVVRLTASPDLAPVIRSVASHLTSPRGSCPVVRVRSKDSALVAKALEGGTGRRPDVWVPDSSLWLQRTGQTTAATGSVGLSPVVLAAAPTLGGRLTRDGASGSLGVVAPRNGRDAIEIILRDPRRSARSGLALVGLQTALSHRRDARRTFAGLLESAALDREGDDLRAPLRVAAGTALPASEQQVFDANRGKATPGLIALYSTGRGSVLDFPFAVLTRSALRRADADQLLAALRGPAGRSALHAAGFRDGTGVAGPALVATLGLDAGRSALSPPARASDVAAVVTELRSVRLRARLLAVLDVSGSMSSAVPGTGTTRMGLVLRAAAQGLARYPDRNSVGLWTFSTRLDGNRDYRQLVPVGVLGPAGDRSSGRAVLAAALARIRPTSGDTGLYDTALAAVRSQQRTWSPRHVNAVLLLTDGRNLDPGGISLSQLLGTLQREEIPTRPVPVISLAYGADPSATVALRRISAVTGGATYTARPREIGQVMLDALGQRACRPLCAAVPLS